MIYFEDIDASKHDGEDVLSSTSLSGELRLGDGFGEEGEEKPKNQRRESTDPSGKDVGLDEDVCIFFKKIKNEKKNVTKKCSSFFLLFSLF